MRPRTPATRGRAPARAAWAIAAALLVAVLIAACASEPEDPVFRRQIFTLGTVVDISLYDTEGPLAEEAIRAVEDVLNGIHRQWHAWEPSELTRLNDALAAGETAQVTHDTATVLRDARALAAASGQLFNPAIGALVHLWGFHSSERPAGPPPDPEAVRALVEDGPDMDDLVIDGRNISSRHPGVRLDLGAFAKGWGVDLAVEALRTHGITSAIVNAGGDLRAIGSHGDRPWRIGVRDPGGSGAIFASLETRTDESVFTSGGYERFFEYGGRRYHHILDPRDGYPAQHTLSVTVIREKAADADAAATALFVAGPDEFGSVAARMGVTHAMLVDADMKVYITPDMAERVRFEVMPVPEVVLVEPAP